MPYPDQLDGIATEISFSGLESGDEEAVEISLHMKGVNF